MTQVNEKKSIDSEILRKAVKHQIYMYVNCHALEVRTCK